MAFLTHLEVKQDVHRPMLPYIKTTVDQDSTVGIVTHYGQYSLGIRTIHTGSGVHPASCTMATGVQGGKGAGAWH